MTVVATLAVGGLSACRQSQDVAVYFGNTAQVTVAEVERIVDDAEDKLAAAQAAALEQQQPGASAPPVQLPFTAADVVGALVGREVGARIAQSRNVTRPQVSPEEIGRFAQALRLPPDAEYARLAAENYALYGALVQSAKPVEYSRDDLLSVYQALQNAGEFQPGLSIEEFESSISPQNQEVLRVGFAVRDEVRAQLDEVDAVLNPRFGRADVDVIVQGSETKPPYGLLTAPIADPSRSPVTDLS